MKVTISKLERKKLEAAVEVLKEWSIFSSAAQAAQWIEDCLGRFDDKGVYSGGQGPVVPEGLIGPPDPLPDDREIPQDREIPREPEVESVQPALEPNDVQEKPSDMLFEKPPAETTFDIF